MKKKREFLAKNIQKQRNYYMIIIAIYKIAIFFNRSIYFMKYVKSTSTMNLNQISNNLYIYCYNEIFVEQCEKCELQKQNLKDSLKYISVLEIIKCILRKFEYPLLVWEENFQEYTKQFTFSNRFKIFTFKTHENMGSKPIQAFLYDFKNKSLDKLIVHLSYHTLYTLSFVNDNSREINDSVYNLFNYIQEVYKISIGTINRKPKITLFPVMKGRKFSIIAIPGSQKDDTKSLYNRIVKKYKLINCPSVFNFEEVCYFLGIEDEMLLCHKNIYFTTIMEAINKEFQGIENVCRLLKPVVKNRRMTFFFTLISEQKRIIYFEDDKTTEKNHINHLQKLTLSSNPNKSSIQNNKSDIVLFYANEFDNTKCIGYNPSSLGNISPKLTRVTETIFTDVEDLKNYLQQWHIILEKTNKVYDLLILDYIVSIDGIPIKLSIKLSNILAEKTYVDSVNVYRSFQLMILKNQSQIQTTSEFQETFIVLNTLNESFKNLFYKMLLPHDCNLQTFIDKIEMEKKSELNKFIMDFIAVYNFDEKYIKVECIISFFHNLINKYINDIKNGSKIRTNEVQGHVQTRVDFNGDTFEKQGILNNKFEYFKLLLDDIDNLFNLFLDQLFSSCRIH